MLGTGADRTTCVIVGGGPAGMVLGLLLARAGVPVTVLEKHADFLRDFRGDTVHPTTVRLLDELGLGARFRALPQSRLQTVSFPAPDGGDIVFGDFTMLRPPYNFVAMVPQWDLLNLLADAAGAEPGFELRMNTEVTSAIIESGKVVGVRYRTAQGVTGELRAELTVGCDGRRSILREPIAAAPLEYPVPFDTWWLQLPRDRDAHPTDGLRIRVARGEFLIMIDRDDFYQVGYFTDKGADARLRAEGVDRFRERIAGLDPALAGPMAVLTDLDQVKLLDVRLDRLPRWHTDGLLLIGDAAHAMSPAGGVGINLAVQDAVAAGRILAGSLRTGAVRAADLAAVQRRRRMPTAVVQGVQRLLHEQVIRPILDGQRTSIPKVPILLSRWLPGLRAVPGYLVGRGPRPEHAPAFARRATLPVPTT